MEKIALYAGSFDPFTNGHLDILQRSFALADKVVVAIGIQVQKKTLFSFEERVDLITEVGKELLGIGPDRLQVISFDTLLVDKAREIGASFLIRGLRDGTDLDYEMQMAGMNSIMSPELQTVFLPASVSGRVITSTLVRQIASMGGDVTPFVPENIARALHLKFQSSEESDYVS
ncbi:pantetheine-phosphate adenylyltransferase [Bartonella krasnovii]|uniref:Phosphopantetheine adenylyltransferase n=1 Tax=Bartonella krasnovii TaxID=2267275 RepID=A0A5B9D0J1_9HYPH|nr:pantetheine-phosphate adenylyltransferase [Bartonella krasnovii]QEE12037.1 pantetheine-phosphate adenylyltransferase [Bartonella krasnovii]UNF29944.1 pantetheine-phosphate adenylyltransferase [Bartonella krasnovii]UNF36305.1 pantetheine-phosphate adenylyltransferase [Bartonella krasnovii]UNF36416.1 pantetheine-phosphate adenylyltransferase [Bartonella krasnovii]UNF38091.1 pantetheine-phosphate adenylyltransferase [Bartonella krasnovii]